MRLPHLALPLATLLSTAAFACGSSNGGSGTEADASGDSSNDSSNDTSSDASSDSAGDTSSDSPDDASMPPASDGGDAADTSTPPDHEGGTQAIDGGGTGEGGDAAAPITVAGNVIVEGSANSPEPIAARKVTIVDANGTRTDVTSDGSGAFTVSGVMPPYDAVVAAGPISQSNPIAFLGVSTPHPRLFGWPDSLPAPARSASINVVVQEPACGSSACNVQFSPYDCSFSGTKFNGGETTGYTTATTQTFAGVPVDWSGSNSAACAGLNVLVSDDTYSHFWYAQSGVNNLANGATATTSTVTPMSIPSAGTVTLSVTVSPLIPAAWGEPDLMVSFNYPSAQGNGFAYLTRVNGGTSVVSGVPNIVGATLSASAAIGSDFNSPMPDPNLTQRVYAGAVNVPLSTTSAPLTLGPPLSLSSPVESGSLSASTGSVTWTWGSSGEVMDASFVAIGDASASVQVEVYTGGTTIDLARLAKAGVTLNPSLQRGRFSGVGKVASLDAMLDQSTLAQPDGSESVYTTITFTLTP